jgi:hypothetical protein
VSTDNGSVMFKYTLGIFIATALDLGCAAAQDIDASSFLKGECKTEVNQIDIGCNGPVAYTKLPNGRVLISFVSNEIATLSFVGNGLVPVGDPNSDSSVLWVDRVRLNQAANDADGQCGIEVDKAAQNSVKIECRALLKDGRKIAASMRSTEGWHSIVGKPPSGQAERSETKEKCLHRISTYSFLMRAMFQCRFRDITKSIFEAARECAETVSEAENKEAVEGGMEMFNRNEKERGHARVCRDVLRDFRNFVIK